mgnify:FL=1
MESIDRDRLLHLHTEMTQEARRLMEAKNHDYSGGKDASDPFLNFTRVQKLGITDTKTGFLVRMTDKLSRLITFSHNNKFRTKDEALKDTILDLINYSVLLYAYSQTEKGDYKE